MSAMRPYDFDTSKNRCKTDNSPLMYMNEDQRNVHIWASQYVQPGVVRLVAGFFCTQTYPRNFSSQKVHEWLEYFYPLADQHASEGYVHRIVKPPGNWDPRINGLPRDDNAFHKLVDAQDTKWLLRSDDWSNVVREPKTGACEAPFSETFTEGNYLVIIVPQDTSARYTLRPNWCNPLAYTSYPHLAEIREPLWTFRDVTLSNTLTGTGTGTGTAQSANSGTERKRRKANVIKNVRIRDGGCLLSSQRATMRGRGYMFDGLEVAHLFPLAYAHQFSTCFPPGDDIYTVLDVKRDALHATMRAALDCEKNAIVLRSDLHALFDQYQFSFEMMGNRLYMVRFEKDARPFRDELDKQLSWQLGVEARQLTRIAPSVSGKESEKARNASRFIDPPHPDLFKVHYYTALTWHVAGAGRRPTANSVLVQGELL